jgi:hypothetical protein
MKFHSFFLTALALWPALSPSSRTAEHRADVVVYGATAAGVIAAVAVAREGRTVLLVDPGRHVGGMVSGGLGATDTGNRGAIGGYSREFFDRVRTHYTKTYGADAPAVKACSDGFHFEPHVALAVFKAMLAEVKVTPHFDQPVRRVEKKGAHLLSLVSTTGDTFAGTVFIDASYEGDLMARAGVASTVGREGRAQYRESLAGVQARSPAHQWPITVPPFVKGGEKARQLLPFIQPDALEEAGTGDRKVQAYNFRLCMTDRKDNQVPFERPKAYAPERYELLARYLARKPDLKVAQLMNPVRLPNDKTDTNNNGPFSTDHIGAGWAYPGADYRLRATIWQDHLEYTQGFLYFLANDPQVPPALHKEMQRWGLAKDEFLDTDHWPPQLYVREARRMVGVYVMTQADLMDNRTKDDSVGLGSYNTDSHHVQRVAVKDAGGADAVLNEGDFQVPVQPYAIPYRSLLPKEGQCDNLVVPVCLSASHVAYGSIRMEPVYMILGQAAGVAASLAVDGKTTVQKVPADRLTDLLKKQKAVLSPAGLTGPTGSVRRLDPTRMAGIVVDNRAARVTGDWKASSALGPIVGADYLHDNNEAKGKGIVRFTPRLPAAGRYEVCLHYPPGPNRAGNTLVVIHGIRGPEGEKSLRIDQRKAGKEGVSLGVHDFPAGESAWLEIRNEGSEGYVIADAVQWLPVK